MRDGVEVSFYIDVHDVQMAASQQFIHSPQRIVATAPGSKAVALRGKLTLEDGFNHHSERALHHAVAHGGDSQRSLFRTTGLRDPYPFDWLGLIDALLKLLVEGE